MYHWSYDVSQASVVTLCDRKVLRSVCAKSYAQVTCEECLKKINLLKVTCPVIIDRSGKHLRGCGEQYLLKDTRVTRSFLRLCPTCPPAKLPVVLDQAGDTVRLPPKGYLAGMSGEDDEARKGIILKGNE